MDSALSTRGPDCRGSTLHGGVRVMIIPLPRADADDAPPPLTMWPRTVYLGLLAENMVASWDHCGPG